MQNNENTVIKWNNLLYFEFSGLLTIAVVCLCNLDVGKVCILVVMRSNSPVSPSLNLRELNRGQLSCNQIRYRLIHSPTARHSVLLVLCWMRSKCDGKEVVNIPAASQHSTSLPGVSSESVHCCALCVTTGGGWLHCPLNGLGTQVPLGCPHG